jgi:hypothetical protein
MCKNHEIDKVTYIWSNITLKTEQNKIFTNYIFNNSSKFLLYLIKSERGSWIALNKHVAAGSLF